jgi:hypothetical protein
LPSPLATAVRVCTVGFLLTVLPSQNKACYQQHFLSTTWWYDWLAVGGFRTGESTARCNDLIISGHATVTATMACRQFGIHEQ